MLAGRYSYNRRAFIAVEEHSSLMGNVIIILIIIFVAWPLVRYVWFRWIQPWLIRRASNKMEDYIRAASGMPPREKKAHKSSSRRDDGQSYGRRRSQSAYSAGEGPLIPKEYAVDVEYTEIREYSSAIEITGEESHRRHRRHSSGGVNIESQVSDVEYVEIKTSARG